MELTSQKVVPRLRVPIGVRCVCYAYLEARDVATTIRSLSRKEFNEICITGVLD